MKLCTFSVYGLWNEVFISFYFSSSFYEWQRHKTSGEFVSRYVQLPLPGALMSHRGKMILCLYQNHVICYFRLFKLLLGCFCLFVYNWNIYANQMKNRKDLILIKKKKKAYFLQVTDQVLFVHVIHFKIFKPNAKKWMFSTRLTFDIYRYLVISLFSNKWNYLFILSFLKKRCNITFSNMWYKLFKLKIEKFPLEYLISLIQKGSFTTLF